MKDVKSQLVCEDVDNILEHDFQKLYVTLNVCMISFVSCSIFQSLERISD